jgi:MFS transporter, ACS family, pantothenate transporter
MTQIGGGMSGLFFSWANEICSVDNEERSLVVALMNDMAYVLQAIVPNFTWKQTNCELRCQALSAL